MFKQKRGQSTIEYAVMAAVVVGALLLMQVYMQRGVAGKLRTATDQIGDQFHPVHYTANFGTHSNGTRLETATPQGATTSTIGGETPEVQERRGSGGEGTTGTETLTDTITEGERVF